MLFIIVSCVILIFLLSIILVAMNKKNLKTFKLSFSWPCKITVEFMTTNTSANAKHTEVHKSGTNVH